LISGLHSVGAWIVVIANGVAGAWALAAHFVTSLRRRELWVVTAIAQILLFVEVALGVVRLSQLKGDPPEFHTLYGFLTLVGVGILYGYRSQVEHLRYLLYGGGGLFIMGLAIRAMTLDATPVIG